MKLKKPDRFERMVSKKTWDGLDVKDPRSTRKGMWASEAIKLLRREHAWMRRMVKKYMKSIDGLQADLHPDFVCGYMQAGHEFLALLDQRRK